MARVVRNFVSALTCLALLYPLSGDAASRKSRSKPERSTMVFAGDYFDVSVRLRQGNKTKNFSVQCFNNGPGVVRSTARGLMFDSYSRLIKNLQGKRQTSATRARIAQFKRLSALAKRECASPDFLALERYRGPFTEREAHVLFNRFAFGGSPTQIQEAVSRGLEATVRSLTTHVDEPDTIAAENDYLLVGHRWTDLDNGQARTDVQTNPANPEDFYRDGQIYGFLRTLLRSRNPYFYKMFMFLHDERATAAVSAAQYAYGHARLSYVDMLRRAAISGDYRQMLSELIRSTVVNFLYLDGKYNRGGYPNENFAREWWEIFSIGPTTIDGLISNRIVPETATYTDMDVAQAARAFSGAAEYCEEKTFPDGPDQGSDPDEQWVCGVDFFLQPPGHAVGPKTIFSGTPYQATVQNYMDMLNVTLNDPRLAESLALDLWREFISYDNVTPAAVRKLAKKIRDYNYNLNRVMQDIMMSRAVFASRNRGSLIKHPVELVVGFLRQTGIPLFGYRPYAEMEDWLDDMGQVPLLPPSVFGWDEKRLAGEQKILSWRNTVMEIINDDRWFKKPDGGWDSDKSFYRLTYLPGVANADGLITKLSSILGIELNAAQRGTLLSYIQNDYFECPGQNKNNCNGQNSILKPRAFDARPEIEDNEGVVRGVMAALAMLDSYRTK